MRRLTAIVLAFFVIVLAIAVCLKPLVITLAKKEIRKTFGAQAVSIQDCRFGILWLSLRGVSFKAAKAGQDFIVENGSVTIDFQSAPGNLFIGKLQYGKLKIENFKARVRMEGMALVLDRISGQILNGLVHGGIAVKFGQSPLYLANLGFIDLDLARFVQDFDLNKKMRMAGLLSGNLTVNGHGIKIQILNGNLSVAPAGGIMTIKDTSFLQNMARNTNQPLNIVVDSLKDYHYNTGGAKLHLDQGDLVLDMALDGEAGKRDLKVTLHDFHL